MRIGILSDTHNQADRTTHAVELLCQAGAELLFHCGDFVEAPILELLTSRPCYFVFGNNDGDSIPDLRRISKSTGAVCLEWGGVVELAGKRIAVTHGHLMSELRPLLTAQPDYLLSGHSHHELDRYDGKTRRINPGALFRSERYTVACLDLATDEFKWIEVPPIRTSLTTARRREQKKT